MKEAPHAEADITRDKETGRQEQDDVRSRSLHMENVSF